MQSSTTAYILVNGDYTPSQYSLSLQKHYPAQHIIAVDGGVRHAKTLGLTPELWVGDFDSSPENLHYPHAQKEVYPRHKDMLDSEIALDHVQNLGVHRVLLIGATGGRTDHTLTLLMMAQRYPQLEWIFDSGSEQIFMLKPGNLTLSPPVGSTLSIIPMQTLLGLSLVGMQWELTAAQVDVGSGRCMSNITQQPEVSISCSGGWGFVCITAATSVQG